MTNQIKSTTTEDQDELKQFIIQDYNDSYFSHLQLDNITLKSVKYDDDYNVNIVFKSILSDHSHNKSIPLCLLKSSFIPKS